MKRNYSKPVFAVESFQVDAAVAGSCGGTGYTAIGHQVGSCWNFADSERVFDANLDCMNLVSYEGAGANDKGCYHGPNATDGTTVYLCS